MLDAITDERLAVFVAWIPILEEDSVAALPRTTDMISDERATHFWDGDGSLQTYASILGLPRGTPAWDLYLLFARGITWDEQPPAPGYWMHQLDPLSDRFLDVGKLRAEVGALLTA